MPAKPVSVRYMRADAIKEEFLFCDPLSETTKAADVLQMVNNFFAKQDFNWKRNIGSLCTDEAPAMLGKTLAFASLIKKRSSSHHYDSFDFCIDMQWHQKLYHQIQKKFCLLL